MTPRRPVLPPVDGEWTTLEVPFEAVDERLDRFLAERLSTPRNQIRHWIDEDRVRVDDRPAKASARLELGSSISFLAPDREGEIRMSPEPGELKVLWEDDHIVAVDKPAGLTVHPGAGRPTGTLAHRLLHHFPEMALVGGAGRPGIVHRLDRETSGILVAARTPGAYLSLSRAFATRETDKRYLAIVYGEPTPSRGSIDSSIGRHPSRRKEMAVRPVGRPAHTEFQVLASAARCSLLEVVITTGRTHQIRVHLKAAGYPLIGDPIYGEARWKGLTGGPRSAAQRFPRPALHAWQLGLLHPESEQYLDLVAPVPEDLETLWRDLGGDPEDWPEAVREARPPG